MGVTARAALRALIVSLNARLEMVRAADFHGIKLQTQFLCRQLAFFPGLRIAGILELPQDATRASFDTVSLSSSRRFRLLRGKSGQSRDVAAGPRQAFDVPGSNRIESQPHQTTGIVLVAFLAATIAGVPVVITSTLRRTSSSAKAGSRSSFLSADRYSKAMFFPSTYPSSAEPCAGKFRRAENLDRQYRFRASQS